MLNNCQIIGRVGKDPELKATSSGVVCNLTVATTEKSGQNEYTEWFSVVSFGKLGEICGKYLRKGALVYFDGSIRTNSWEDKSGQKKFKTQLIARNMKMLGAKQNDEFDQRREEEKQNKMFNDNNAIPERVEDDLPF